MVISLVLVVIMLLVFCHQIVFPYVVRGGPRRNNRLNTSFILVFAMVYKKTQKEEKPLTDGFFSKPKEDNNENATWL